MKRKRTPSGRSPFERDLDKAIATCKAMGFGVAIDVTERGIEIPYLAVDENKPTGRGIGTRGMSLILAVADAYGKAVLVPPSNGGSARFFAKLGFAWPEEEVVCQETDLLSMVREPPKASVALQTDAPSTPLLP